MAYDAYDGYVVYFGGSGSSPILDQTWIFSNSTWYNETRSLVVAPPARSWPAMTYDALYDVVLLYGGCTAHACPDNSTWDFTGGSGWTNLTDSLAPASAGLVGASMAFAADSADGYTVLYGGCTDSACQNRSNVTYGFDGFGWLAIPTPHSPPAGYAQGMAYDVQLGELVAFGGCGSSGCNGSESWTYYNFDWTNATAALAAAGPTPPGRAHLVLTWDELDDELLLAGGASDTGAFSDTWALACPPSGCLWKNLSASAPLPFAGFGAAAPSDSNASAGTMFFGGAFETRSPYNASGPFRESNGTYFFEPALFVTATFPASAPARSAVRVTAHPSGGSGSYAQLPPSYAAVWRYNGSTATGVNATLNFSAPGTYAVELTLYDRFGVSAADNFSVVATGPTSAIRAATSASAGVPFNLSAAPASGGNAPYSYLWTFGDGTVGSGITTSHVWGVTGAYTVWLYVVDAESVTFRESLIVTVVLAPSVAVTATNTTLDLGGSVTFTPWYAGTSTPATYAWSFGDGTAGSHAVAPNHTFLTAGRFIVTVNVTDAAGISTWGSIALTVNPLLSATLSGGTSATVGTPDAFAVNTTGGTTPYSYTWRFGDGDGAVGPSVAHTYGRAGTYALKVWVNDSVGGTTLRVLTVQVDNATAPIATPPSGILGGLSGPSLVALVFVAAVLFAIVAGWRWRRRHPSESEPPSVDAGPGEPRL